jgi:ATP-binding cassette subfamily C protein CydC
MNHLVRFLTIARGQRNWMLAGIFLGVIVIAANSLLMAVSGWFIASMAVSGSSGVAFNYFFPSASIRFLAIARTVGRYAERLITHEATFRILEGLRVWLFKRFEPLAPAGLERYADGDVVGRLRADVDALETLYLKIIAPLVVGLISIVAGCLFLFVFSPPSAAVMLLFLALSGLCLPLLIQRLSAPAGRKSVILAAELRNKISEGIQGVEELILLGAIERQSAAVDSLSGQLISEQERLGRVQGLSFSGMVLFSGSAIAAVLMTASMQVSLHQIPPPNLVMLLLFSAALFESVGPMSSALHLLPAAQESAARIFDLADSPPPVPVQTASQSLPDSTGICFKQVSAAYLPGTRVLQNISFSVPAGGAIVLTGPSGVGKSLLLETLLRFRTYEGSLTIGGVELATLPKALLHEMIAAVPQRPHLFNGTIRENILLGNASADDDALVSVLRDCCLETWVKALPLGLDTQVGRQGSKISGGEARRIALARALLKGAPILLLDEPTEGLDTATEAKVVSHLKRRLMDYPDTTLLVISHRPACLALGNSVIHLERP